jgi:hypothetical protein
LQKDERKAEGSQKTGNDDDDDDDNYDDMAMGTRRATFAIAEKLDVTSQVQTGPDLIFILFFCFFLMI